MKDDWDCFSRMWDEKMVFRVYYRAGIVIFYPLSEKAITKGKDWFWPKPCIKKILWTPMLNGYYPRDCYVMGR